MGCKRKDAATALDEQFENFAAMMDSRRNGTTINLLRSDYWLKQARIIDNRKVTLVDSAKSFIKFIPPPPPPEDVSKKKKRSKAKKEPSEIFRKDEITYSEWLKFLRHLCRTKKICLERTKEHLTKCGLPGHVAPPIRPYFYYIPKLKWPDGTDDDHAKDEHAKDEHREDDIKATNQPNPN